MSLEAGIRTLPADPVSACLPWLPTVFFLQTSHGHLSGHCVPVPGVLDLPGRLPSHQKPCPGPLQCLLGSQKDLQGKRRPGHNDQPRSHSHACRAMGPADTWGLAQATGSAVLRRRSPCPRALVPGRYTSPSTTRPCRAGLCMGSSSPSLRDSSKAQAATAPAVCIALE